MVDFFAFAVKGRVVGERSLKFKGFVYAKNKHTAQIAARELDNGYVVFGQGCPLNFNINKKIDVKKVNG